MRWCDFGETREALQAGLWEAGILPVERENGARINEGGKQLLCPGQSMSLAFLNIFKGKTFLVVTRSDFQGLFQPKQFCGCCVERVDVTPCKSSVEIRFHVFLVFSGKIHVAYLPRQWLLSSGVLQRKVECQLHSRDLQELIIGSSDEPIVIIYLVLLPEKSSEFWIILYNLHS